MGMCRYGDTDNINKLINTNAAYKYSTSVHTCARIHKHMQMRMLKKSEHMHMGLTQILNLARGALGPSYTSPPWLTMSIRGTSIRTPTPPSRAAVANVRLRLLCVQS